MTAFFQKHRVEKPPVLVNFEACEVSILYSIGWILQHFRYSCNRFFRVLHKGRTELKSEE